MARRTLLTIVLSSLYNAGGGWGRGSPAVPPPNGVSVSIYERLKEESDAKKKAKARRKARPVVPVGTFEKGREAARRKRSTLWRYYRAAARNRRIAQKEEIDRNATKT